MSGVFAPSSLATSSKQFIFLAERRRKEAVVLLNEKHWLGAFYLAGYTFECALKAMLAKLNKDTLPGIYQNHNVEELRKAVLPHVSSTSAQTLQSVPAWTHLLRYDCKIPAPGTVVQFINRVREAYRCLSTYI